MAPVAATALGWLKHSSFQVTVYLTEMQAASLIFYCFPDVKWDDENSSAVVQFSMGSVP